MNDLDAAHLAQLREADARYKETWDLSDLEARIRLARDVLRSHGSDTAQELLALEEDISVTIDSQAVAAEPEWAINPRIAVCLELASALEDRHTHLGLLEDLQEQISILELALQKVPPDSHAGICIRRDLGTALRQRFSQKSNELDLLQAIDIHTSSLESCPDGHPIRAHLLGLLALDLLDQGYRTGQADVLERSVSLAQQGADISLTSDPRHHQVQRCLSTALLGSFFVLGGANRLHAAKDICITLLNTFPPHCPIVTTIYGQLGVIMSQLFAQTDDMDYLKLTVEYTSLAFERIAKSSGLRPTIALNFASSLGLLHNRTGDIKDLQRGIEVLKEVQHIPNRADAHIFAQLGLSLCTLHSLLGEPDDLDESVRLLRKAAALHSNGGRPRIAAVENLAVALHARYKRDRILGDLAEGIELEREALQFYQSNKSHSLPAFNLANYLREYYRATGEVSYLEGSLAMFTEWFGYLDQSADSQMTHQGNWLRHHAEALLLRYELKSNPDDVYTAISQLRKSHELHPTTHVNHADTLINLAEALFHKMQIDHLDQDAHDALQCLTAALDSLPTGHPTRATPLFMMAKLYAMDTCPFQHIQKAVSSLRDGLQDRYQNALTRLTSALPILAALGEKTLRRDDHQLQQDLVDAYYSAVNLLPRVAYFGQDLPSRLRALASSDKLAADGAAHALLLSNPKLAIELLEQGRAVFWTQFLRLRSEFDGLPQAVASRLTQIAHALDQGAYVIQNRALSATENGNKAMVSKQEQQFVERRRLGNEFENMLGQVRQAPGLERFLLHNTFDMLAKVAEHGPVVVLLASEVTCQVIIIHSHGSATQILLPKVTVPYLEELGQKVAENISFKRGLLRNRGVITKAKNQRTGILEVTLDVLWRSVMSKVVHVLALKVRPMSHVLRKTSAHTRVASNRSAPSAYIVMCDWSVCPPASPCNRGSS